MHQLIDAAVGLACDVTVPEFYNEWEPINKDAARPCDRYSLYTEFEKNPLLACAPDAGFLIEKGGHKKAFYLEVDRGTDSIKRICSKSRRGMPGYKPSNGIESISRRLPWKISRFLFVTTTDYRRDELAKRLADYEGKSLWKFACYRDVKPETLLFEPIWHGVDSEPHPLVKK